MKPRKGWHSLPSGLLIYERAVLQLHPLLVCSATVGGDSPGTSYTGFLLLFLISAFQAMTLDR